jgi:hypothetical protein
MIRDQLLKLSQVEMRHCVLLGRLEGIAESLDVSLCLSIVFPFNFAVYALLRIIDRNVRLSACKRRALPASEVAAAVLESSPVPMFTAGPKNLLPY